MKSLIKRILFKLIKALIRLLNKLSTNKYKLINNNLKNTIMNTQYNNIIMIKDSITRSKKDIESNIITESEIKQYLENKILNSLRNYINIEQEKLYDKSVRYNAKIYILKK